MVKTNIKGVLANLITLFSPNRYMIRGIKIRVDRKYPTYLIVNTYIKTVVIAIYPFIPFSNKSDLISLIKLLLFLDFPNLKPDFFKFMNAPMIDEKLKTINTIKTNFGQNIESIVDLPISSVFKAIK